jgi:tetratricopeptide (TPR) repeat protein
MKFIWTLILVGTCNYISGQSLIDYYELGEYSKVIKSFEETKSPSTEDQFITAKAFCAKGMTSECMKTYHEALKNSTVTELLKSKFQYAKILQTQGYHKKADSLYSNLLEAMPENAEVLYQKGKVAESLKKMAFHQHYLEALLYDPTHIKAAHEASRYFMKVDNLKMAKSICLKTLEKVPHTPRLINLLAQIHYRIEDYKASLGYITELESLKSDLPKFIYEIKGNSFLKLNQNNNALTAFKKAFKIDSKDPQICLKIAELYLLVNDSQNAQKYLFRYQFLRDTSLWEYNFLMGKMYMQKKDYRMAFYQFEKALDENVRHEDSRYFRAVSADNFMEDKSKALDYYTNYIEFFEDEETSKYVDLALRRETEIRRELFMKQ